MWSGYRFHVINYTPWQTIKSHRVTLIEIHSIGGFDDSLAQQRVVYL